MRYIYNFIEKVKNNYKIYILNILIIIIWLIFIYFNWITKSRLIIFFLILLFIFFYKFIFNYVKNNDIQIKSEKILKLLIYINKYRNPIILLLIQFEKFIFNLLCIYNNKLLKIIIYIMFILLINPINVFYYKFYNLLDLWKNNKYYKILINRMLGLILSILIFTNIIYMIQYILGINLFILIYLYLLIVSLLSEYYDKFTCKNKILKIFLVHNISLFNLVSIRLHSNLISKIIESNSIEENFFYLNSKNIYIIEKFKFGSTWSTINTVKNYKDKLSYWLYFNTKSLLDDYLDFMRNYIYMDLNSWDIKDMDKIKFNGKLDNFNLTDFEKSKFIYEYDYKIFKILLFLVFEIETYLNHDIKKIIDIEEEFNTIIYNCYKSTFSIKKFIEKIKNKESKFELFNEDILIKLYPYLFYTKRFKDFNKNENFKYYKKLYLIFPDVEVDELKEVRCKNYDMENKEKYIKYMDNLYEEWLNIENRKVKYNIMLNELQNEVEKMKNFATKV